MTASFSDTDLWFVRWLRRWDARRPQSLACQSPQSHRWAGEVHRAAVGTGLHNSRVFHGDELDKAALVQVDDGATNTGARIGAAGATVPQAFGDLGRRDAVGVVSEQGDDAVLEGSDSTAHGMSIGIGTDSTQHSGPTMAQEPRAAPY
jgi:hypothetical protein